MSRRPRRLAIRTRLTLWYTGILFAILVVTSGFSYFMLRRSLVADLDVELAMVGQLVGAAASGDARRSDAELREILGPQFYQFSFRVDGADGPDRSGWDGAGRLSVPLSGAARLRGARGDRTFETVVVPGGAQVRVLWIPLPPETAPRFIQVGASLNNVARALFTYVETLAVLVPLGLGLAATGGAWLARSALMPVQTMARTARRITAEDLARRLSLSGTGDELDYLAETLNAMFGRLETAFDHVRRFAADAAHELRTPLTALKGGLEVALRAERSPENYREVLRSSLQDVDRVVRLAEGLLLLSRVRSGAPARREPVELEPLVLEVLDVGLPLAQRRGVTLSLGRVEPVAVHGDRVTLWRALLNLVENAVKYTPRGGRVEIDVGRDGDQAVIDVRDTGVGMDTAAAEKIFEPFVRLDAARADDPGGSGLGLSIVRAIVATHDGTVSVHSAPGAGSTFTVRLPLLPAPRERRGAGALTGDGQRQ